MANDLPICNGCGKQAPTSKEHFLHVAIARVMLGNMSMPEAEVRARLARPPYSEIELYTHLSRGGGRERPMYPHKAMIRNLLCRDCNNGWANELELSAARNMHDFIQGGRANGDVLRRWAWFFFSKAWWLHRKTDKLAQGFAVPGISVLRQEGYGVKLPPVRLARVTFNPTAWNTLWTVTEHMFTPGPRFVVWGLRGLVWFVVAEPTADDLPVPSVEVLEGLRFPRVPPLRRPHLQRLIPMYLEAFANA
jgi:hypothetical protein